jgi:predicted peptidase
MAESVKTESGRFPSFVPRELDALFLRGSFPAPVGSCYDQLEYRLFKPVAARNVGERFPLILFFHGHGSHELNWRNVGQLKHLDKIIFRDISHPELYPFYILAVQCPHDRENRWLGWLSSGNDNGANSLSIAPAELALQVADALAAEYPIDQDRIYLLGISSGGNACWELALRHPERFAAMVSTSTGGPSEASPLSKIKDIPIWAFHSQDDHPEAIRQTIQVLKSVGGNCHLTETIGRSDIMGGLHNSWYAAFQDYNALDWMLAQRRSAVGPLPGARPWPWKTLGIVTAAALLIYVGWWSEKKRRERQSKSNS